MPLDGQYKSGHLHFCNTTRASSEPYPQQHRVSTVEVSTPLRYRVKKLCMARICVANCCGSYAAGFSTDRKRLSIVSWMNDSFFSGLPFFCAIGTNVWSA